jgi:hypothetical protein
VEERINSYKISLIRFKTRSKHAVDVFANRSYHQSIFSPVDVIEVDVLVLDVIELDVLGARRNLYLLASLAWGLFVPLNASKVERSTIVFSTIHFCLVRLSFEVIST